MSYLRNHKLLLLIISVLLAANIALLYFFVFNKPEHPAKLTGEQMRKHQLEKVQNEVGLDDGQLAFYDSLRNKQFKNMKPLFKDVTSSKEDFFSLIYQEGASDSLINAYAAEIGEKQTALDLSTFRYFQSIKGLCTEEQKPKMDSFIKQIVKKIIYNGPRQAPEKKDK